MQTTPCPSCNASVSIPFPTRCPYCAFTIDGLAGMGTSSFQSRKDQQHRDLLFGRSVNLYNKQFNASFDYYGNAELPDVVRFAISYGDRTTVMSPHFNSVSGETFNKSGKTDILIRHEGKNLFVAECGIWKGAKQFLGKIDQLLSYLTWRDSKTALICFVRNKEFGAVVETIKKEIPSHACFVKGHPPVGEAWLRYEFSLKDDPSRSVKIAVLCFHYP